MKKYSISEGQLNNLLKILNIAKFEVNLTDINNIAIVINNLKDLEELTDNKEPTTNISE